MLQTIEEAVLHAAGQWWVLLATFLLCTIDGFFPVVPSESVLVALASISGTEQTMSLWALWAVGALGAIAGDQIAYFMGRKIGTERFRWMRLRTVQKAVASARTSLDRHGAMVITTARFIPGGRVAVNYTAGATGYSHRWFTILDIIAAMIWSGYSIGVARATAGWLDNTLLQMAVAVVFAGVLGWVIDLALKRVYAHVVPRSDVGQVPGEAGDAGEARVEPGGSAVDSPRDRHR